MQCKIIDGKKIANEVQINIKKRIDDFKRTYNITPCLNVILTTDDNASKIYVHNKHLACKKVGINGILTLPFQKMPIESFNNPLQYLISIVEEANINPNIHGILIQLPLPTPIQPYTTHIFDKINPLKDVDVFHPINVGLLVQNRPRFLPCTPQGIQVMLKMSNIDLYEKQVVVINRSDIVGKPLSSMLIQDQKDANATVTICHDKTKPEILKKITRTADIVVVGVGIPNFLTSDMIRDGAVVIDVGITRIGKKIVGDVDFENVSKKAYAITPVPGGVGPMTVTMLLENTLKAAENITSKL